MCEENKGVTRSRKFKINR